MKLNFLNRNCSKDANWTWALEPDLWIFYVFCLFVLFVCDICINILKKKKKSLILFWKRNWLTEKGQHIFGKLVNYVISMIVCFLKLYDTETSWYVKKQASSNCHSILLYFFRVVNECFLLFCLIFLWSRQFLGSC